MFYFFLVFNLYYMLGYNRLSQPVNVRKYNYNFLVWGDWFYNIQQIIFTIWFFAAWFMKIDFILLWALTFLCVGLSLTRWFGWSIKVEFTFLILRLVVLGVIYS